VKYVINDQVVLMRSPEGPVTAFIRPFAAWVSEQGYAMDALRRRIRIVAGFSRWLAEKALRPRAIRSRHCAQYLRYRARQLRIYPGDGIALSQFLELLRRHGVTPTERAPQSWRICGVDDRTARAVAYS
jgi:integrase/recombinase XerD